MVNEALTAAVRVLPRMLQTTSAQKEDPAVAG